MRKFFTRYQYTVYLIVILCSALFLRVIDLSNTPSGLHADEASFLINAHALSETWRDEDGRFLPLSLYSLIDPKPALYAYAQLPFLALFGPSILAARLPAAIAGTISVFLVYVLFRRITGQLAMSLLVALLIAISPWHIMLSRASQEVIFSSLFVLIAGIFLSNYIKSARWSQLLLLAVFSFLAMYSYHSTKIFLMLSTVIFSGYLWKAKIFSAQRSFVLLLVMSVVFISSLLIQESNTRFAAVGFLNNQETQLVIDEHIRKATGRVPEFVIRTFYNKPVFYVKSVITEYLAHFSPQFLFLEGGEPKRYFIPHHGLMYWLELPLLLLGLAIAIRRRSGITLAMIAWLVLAPAASALTYQETPSVIRSFLMVFPLLYFVALAIMWLVRSPSKIAVAVIGVLILGYAWSLGYFGMQYSLQQKVVTPWYRNNPYLEIAQSVASLEPQYNQVLVTNDLRPLYAYFVISQLISIEQLQAQPRIRDLDEYTIGKYRFNRGVCDLGTLEPDILYVAEVECRTKLNYPQELRVVQTISYDDGLPVYELLEVSEDAAEMEE